MSQKGADEIGDLCKTKWMKDRKYFSILTQFNTLSLSDVKRSQRNRIGLNDRTLKLYSKWMYACLDNSITEVVRYSLDKYSRDVDNEGPTFLFVLLSITSKAFKNKLESLKKAIKDFDPKTYSWNVEMIHNCLNYLIADYKACTVFAVDQGSFGDNLLTKLTQSPSESFNSRVAISQLSLKNKGETIHKILSQLGEDCNDLVLQGIW